ncbi:MAG: PQQ-binding-like beta-propeller repeat protein [Arachnia sp.]
MNLRHRNHPRNHLWIPTLGAVACLVLAGCSGQGDDGAGTSDADDSAAGTPSEAAPQPETGPFEMPLVFDQTGVPIEAEVYDTAPGDRVSPKFELEGTTLVGNTNEAMIGIDLSTGESNWEHSFQAPNTTGEAFLETTNGPVLADGVAYAAGPLLLGGVPSAEVMAVDIDSGERLWTAIAPDISSNQESGNLERSWIAAASDEVVLVGQGEEPLGSTPSLTALDPDSGEVLWQARDVAVHVLLDGLIVAVHHEIGCDHLVGLEVATGEPRWTSQECTSLASIVESAQGTVLISMFSDDLDNFGEPISGLVDITTGAIAEGGDFGGADLDSVGPVVTVDLGVNTDEFSVVDAGSLESLWQLPSASTTGLNGAVGFGDAIYVTVSGPVFVPVDALTGEELADETPGKAVRVNEYGAIVYLDGELVFLAATGGEG